MLIPGYCRNILGMFYRRRLPHWNPGGQSLFLTWRLHPSAPANALAEPAVAQVAVCAIERSDRQLALFRALAWVVMPDHVHLLFRPAASLARIGQALK
ncbi:MAG: hypothetical protein ACRD2F_13300, partial [Terriglobales bacterium]